MTMTPDQYAAVISSSIVPLALAWLFRNARNTEAKILNGKNILEYGMPLKCIAIIVLLVFAGLVVIYFNADKNSKTAAGWSVVLFSLIGIALFLETFLVKIAFDENEIVCRSGWRKGRIISWSDVLSCHYSNSNSWWVISTSKNGTLKIHRLISGKGEFFNMLTKKTGITIKDAHL